MTSIARSLLKDTLLWRSLRGVKRAMAGKPVQSELPAEQCRGRVTWLNPPLVVEVGSSLEMKLQLENRAGVSWSPTGSVPVQLRVRWLDHQHQPFDSAEMVHGLPFTLYPGEPQEISLTVPVPDFVGDFVLSVDFTQHDREFAEKNTESVRVVKPISVIGARKTDIDYHEVFRTANLKDNHWWVVGAYHSKEQYERSARERLEMLEKHGVTKDSHILDIGCGTGQMASVLMSYLTDRGRYAGTDIGREAIQFAEQTYQRRNISFAVGGMTSVPFHENGTFDCAIFFSVFTHTFLDETALLLAEAKRLLKPTGVIIADVITSELVERAAGHRGEMVVNKNYFLKLAGMLGYSATVIGEWPWNRHATRYMFKLSQ